ncbi:MULTISPECIES: SDR family oxidoreductase [Bradyrhizobium]|uniref:SDR family oxidoreductase n=1 Tax=Bradyrhizobium vignae TaxID=1549949 RepID=A0ABS3ZVA4_9BRAD|nr:SDR family NAD(P)-dependent oxidoreductase [Bradyrhizobium vignae]MBP0112092.1 SDR family oxidoreductase [Bradyrhizobium vignae]RXH04382.1 SDR family oxidoreductase [Bradyrhizobium vignae]
MTGLNFEGRIAVISGGCGGIGRAVRERLVAGGAKVLVWDVADEADERVDLTDETAVDEAMARLLARHGRIDVLVNAAGITGPTVNIEQYSLADWRRVLDVNLTSTFLCCKAAITPMRQQNGGRIVNLASIAGKEGNASMTGYSAAKAGVIALTKSLGKELAGTEIRVNAIAPAVIATDLVKQMTEEAYRNVLAKIPLGRAGLPKEVAALVAWLASDECSFSTGAVFDLSGGRATY